MLIRPIQTEKAYREQTKRSYMFVVPEDTSKQAIAQQITDQYNVTVTSVHTILRKGKATKFSRGKHAYPGTTYRQDKKIAYVTLKDGDSIKVFDEEATDQKASTSTKTKSDKGGDK
ncbi:50S ribosomal protein L23 [Candidatus Saccharibacteria bacterium]|nr:50S ribosomal protein L23 [Candidatus Saccharibacteria bacterium]